MEFGYCGINYKRADRTVRDRVSFTDGKKEEMLGLLENIGINQSMVLSTCNRSEVFYFYQEEGQIKNVRECFVKLFDDEIETEKNVCGNEKNIDYYIEENQGREAVLYLFRVSAGLESMVVGEDQILGQVREALDFSRTMGYAKKELNRVVTDAVACAKKIKASCKISEIPLSVGYVGVKELNRECGIKGKCVMVIGGGQTAGLTAGYISQYCPSKIIICNRTLQRAENIRNKCVGAGCVEIIEFCDRYKKMRECDIVISATSAPHLTVEKEKCIIERHTWFLDLAVPRDIDENLRDNPMCYIADIDSLEKVVEENRKHRLQLSDMAGEIIEKSAEDTVNWLNRTTVDGTIRSLNIKCDEILYDSMDYINRKLSLTKHQQIIVERTVKASLRRLLREPIEELKRTDSKEEQEMLENTVERLFRINK